MTKRKLRERIEELERRVTYLEAVVAARPAAPEAEPVPWWWVPGVPPSPTWPPYTITYTATANTDVPVFGTTTATMSELRI
ncbi:MAG: hypothetical protein EHM39_00045 [Chloroflexi bacterium]|nr:MAG: hypothetical protein EHM39_00045 [Chloroflexota bacterium]